MGHRCLSETHYCIKEETIALFAFCYLPLVKLVEQGITLFLVDSFGYLDLLNGKVMEDAV